MQAEKMKKLVSFLLVAMISTGASAEDNDHKVIHTLYTIA